MGIKLCHKNQNDYRSHELAGYSANTVTDRNNTDNSRNDGFLYSTEREILSVFKHSVRHIHLWKSAL